MLYGSLYEFQTHLVVTAPPSSPEKIESVSPDSSSAAPEPISSRSIVSGLYPAEPTVVFWVLTIELLFATIPITSHPLSTLALDVIVELFSATIPKEQSEIPSPSKLTRELVCATTPAYQPEIPIFSDRPFPILEFLNASIASPFDAAGSISLKCLNLTSP